MIYNKTLHVIYNKHYMIYNKPQGRGFEKSNETCYKIRKTFKLNKTSVYIRAVHGKNSFLN